MGLHHPRRDGFAEHLEVRAETDTGETRVAGALLGDAHPRLVRIDDFLVTLIQDDGTRRTVVRNGAEPKIELRDPSEAHRKLVPTLADKDMHNVTAYLWTIK